MAGRARLGRVWGMTDAEQALPFPCDGLIVPADDELYRAVTVRAPAPIVFRWLCQLRVAPYSYDWIDNAGRQSPPRLIPGLDALVVGQPVMTIFTLIDFEPGRQLTLRMTPHTGAARSFGDIAVSYCVVAHGPHSRLLVKLLVRYPPGITGAVMRRVLPPGDWIMMRRQLLNLRRLAEQSGVPAAVAAG